MDLETDHFVQPKLLKAALSKHDSNEALLLQAVNVRVLSKTLLKEMKKQWASLCLTSKRAPIPQQRFGIGV